MNLSLSPNAFKKVGWDILLSAIASLIILPFVGIVGITYKKIFEWIPADKLNDMLCLIGILGLFIISISKEL
ncbi:MAG: hypothetical protein H7296_02125 [Bacteroidia bacterium]|nr:hypothetical protein [Bacteroidia bacterium]